MQGYFDKIKGSALKAVQTASQQVTLLSSSLRIQQSANNGNNTKDTTHGYKPTNSITIPAHIKTAEEILVYHFQVACETMDKIGEMDEPHSSEADRALYASKVKDHLKSVIALLRDESDMWYSRYSDTTADPEMTELPCLTTLVQTHVLHALCNRACRDIPKGSLPLILGIISSLLRSVRYPILAQQTVHKPIAHLITVAWRFEAFHGDYIHTVQSKADFISYRKRIDIGLTSLLTVLWRKISENPPIIDAFKVVDQRRRKSRGEVDPMEQPVTEFKPQIDVLGALISLMFKLKVGPYARDAIIIAISMNDERIDSFLLYHGHFIEEMLQEFIKRYLALIDYMTTEIQSSMNRPITSNNNTNTSSNNSNNLRKSMSNNSGNSRNSSDYITPIKDKPTQRFSFKAVHENSLNYGNIHDDMSEDNGRISPDSPPPPTPLGGFVSKISSTTPLITSNTSLGYHPITPRQAETKLSPIEGFIEVLRFLDAVMEMSNPKPCKDIYTTSLSSPNITKAVNTTTTTTIKHKAFTSYVTEFLYDNLLQALHSNGELQVLVYNNITTLLLEYFKTLNNNSSLLIATIRSIIGLTPYSSPSIKEKETNGFDGKGSSNLLEVLVSRCGSISKQVSISSLRLLSIMIKVSPLSEAYYILNHSNLNSSLTENDSIEISTNRSLDKDQDTSNINNHLIEKHLSIDDVLNELSSYRINGPIDPKASSNSKDISPRSTSQFKRMIFSVDSEKDILIRIQSERLAQSTNGFENSSILKLVKVKVQSFLTLSLEEQLVIATVLDIISCLLCGNIVIQSNHRFHNNMTIETTDTIDKNRDMTTLYEYETILNKLWTELSNEYLPRIPQLDWKFKAIQHMLAISEMHNIIVVDSNNNSNDNSNSNGIAKDSNITTNSNTTTSVPTINRPKQNSPRTAMIETAAIQYMKMIELESPQTKRILESAVIIRSVFINIQSYLFSVKRLQSIFQLPVGIHAIATAKTPIQQHTADSYAVDSLDSVTTGISLSIAIGKEDVEDMFEEEEDREAMAILKKSIYEVQASPLSNISHQDFLDEISQLEIHLEELIRN